MASLFASPDIAALVAAFPPKQPTRYQPSLVRSNSGNGLLNSTVVLNRFRTLLETHADRISKTDLPQHLGIERIDWLFECYNGSPRIRWSRDGASLIPVPMWNRFIEVLTTRCDESFIDIRSYARSENMQDLSIEELNKLVELHCLEAMGTASGTQDADAYLASKKLVEKIKAEIRSSMSGPSDEKLNISRMCATIPGPILKQLVREMIPGNQLEFDGDDMIFVPTSYHTTQQEHLRVEHEARLQKLLEQFENDDFVQVNTSSQASALNDVEEVSKRYTSLHSDVEVPTILDVDAATKVVVLPMLLKRTIQELKEEAVAFVLLKLDDESIDRVDDEAKSKLCSACPEPVLASIMFNIPSYSDEVTVTMREAQLQRQQKQHERFRDSFCADVIAPIQLYGSGVATITDAKLSSNIDDYVCAYFRRDAIPSFFKPARTDGLLSNDKAKVRETDKFLERSAQSKSVHELITFAIKYAKKVKLQVPNDADLARVRREILERKAFNDIPKMARASDVLQNLLWILLSAATEKAKTNNLDAPTTDDGDMIRSTPAGAANATRDRLALFMSPGKDTGRMIKHYSAVAPDEIEVSKKLGVWREKLKTASETKEDLEDIRDMAKEVVNELFANGCATANVANSEIIA